MRTNGQRSPDEIQADIERTRANLDQTLTAIEHKLSPSELFDLGVDYLRHSGAREYVSNLGASAKQEPIPLALVGIGLAWLMLSNGRHSTTTSRFTSDDLATRAKGAAGSMADSVRGAADGVRDTMASMRDSAARASHRLSDASHRIGQTAHAARERASQMSASARLQAERMRDGYHRVVNEHPLALGAIGLAVGAVLAATARRTLREDRLMGEASHRVKESAREAGKEQFDRAASAIGAGSSDRYERAERMHDDASMGTDTAAPAAPTAARSNPSSSGTAPDRSMH
jgi:hypothetical protein